MPTNFTKRVQALNLQRWGVGAVLLGLGALNKWRFGPAISGGDLGAGRRFRIVVIVEYVLIAAVLSVTAVMTTFFSPE